MSRFFCQAENIFQNEIKIVDKKEIHHIFNVLRLRINDKVICFDGRGKEFIGRIKDASNKKITVEIERIIRIRPPRALKITLACAIPKKAKMDYIIEKTIELGIHKIIPLKTNRTIVNLDKERAISRLNHWRGIALSSAKQAGRIELPTIEPIMSFEGALSSVRDYDLAIIPNLFDKERRRLAEILRDSKPANIIIFIGPEGDFTSEELILAKKAGCLSISLGNLILKVDTAAIAIVAFLLLSGL